MCIVGGSSFGECCPGPTDESTGAVTDGVCNMLWCVDLESISIREGLGCTCSQLEASCGLVGVAPYTTVVPSLGDMCAAVNDCCADDGSTDNAAWGGCMAAAKENGDFSPPDFGSLIPGGVPDIDTLLGAANSTIPIFMPGPVIPDPTPPVDPPVACTADWTPVCGIDGLVYSNACNAGAAGVEVAYKIDPVPDDLAPNGPCPPEQLPETTVVPPTGVAVDPVPEKNGTTTVAPEPTTLPEVPNVTSVTSATQTASGTSPILGLGVMPPSFGCIANPGSSFLECCPSPSDADGICTMLHCVDLSGEVPGVREACGCAQVETACAQLTSVELAVQFVPNLDTMCAAADGCCEADTNNTAWGTCMADKLTGGEYAVPDLEGLLGAGGLPDLTAPVSTTTTTTVVPATGETTTTSTTTPKEPEAGASGPVLGLGAYLIASALASLIV